MSDSLEGSGITPGVKKQTRRFAPVKRGGKSPAAKRREEAAAAATPVEPKTEEGSSTPAASESSETTTKSTVIGTIRPEGSGSGRLQSINDGQKTRGGSAKMKFKPTVPLKRNKKEVSSSTIDEALNKPRNGPGERGGRGARGRGGRGRGRGRGLIMVDTSTASGIFSLGPSAVSRGRPGFGGGGGGFASYGGDVGNRQENDNGNSDMIEMFTSNVGGDTPVTFKHVSNSESDIDPVTLHQKMHKIPWMTVKVEKKTKVKEENVDAMDIEQSTVPEEQPEEDEEDVELPKLYIDSDSPAQNIFALDQKHRLVCVAEEELLQFQLPTVLPKFQKVKIEDDVDMLNEVKTETLEGESTNSLPPAAKKSTLVEAMANLELEDMPNGEIGKLIVYKSGKMKMKFGNILMDVQQGTQSTFLENIMVVDHESEETKKAIELGHIVQKFVCVPSIESLLLEAENK